jgi:predicted nucleic acid-binding protein
VILVDTSVWIDHFRRASADLVSLLNDGQVLTHPFVIGELAMGGLKNRSGTLALMRNLPRAEPAMDDEVHVLVERRMLMGRGLSWIDAHLLASAAISHARLWTLDRRLQEQAQAMGIASH